MEKRLQGSGSGREVTQANGKGRFLTHGSWGNICDIEDVVVKKHRVYGG